MLPAFKPLALAAVVPLFIALSIFAAGQGSRSVASSVPPPDLVELPPGVFRFRASGEFSRDGKPATAPNVTVRIDRTLAVMKHQVTTADYQRCMKALACPLLETDSVASDRPVVGVSWQDAQAYASWLSRETGTRFRLPTDEEWAYAAADRYVDDAMPAGLDLSDPGQRALAIYDREASREKVAEKAPQPIGSFGANENGLLDMAGNVWEWTDTCFQRSAIDAAAEAATVAHCGVRVVEGRHRTYISEFVRDARGGGCSVGAPPSNLGFRLVRDDDLWREWQSRLSWLLES